MTKTAFPRLYKATAAGGVQEWDISGVIEDGVVSIVTVYGLQGGKKQETREVIREGKNAGRKNATTAAEQAYSEIESRWRVKRDRKGYGETVAASAAVRWAGPMLALPYDKHRKKVDWATTFVQPKLDGFRLLAKCSAGGAVSLFSREHQPMPALAEVREAVQAAWVATGAATDVIFDGEAYGHGLSLNQVASACKKASALTTKIQFHVYDCAAGDLPFETRSRFAQEFVAAAGSARIVAVDTIKVRSEAELMKCQQAFIDAGYEGAMLRHGTTGYQAGKRADVLLKVKNFSDAEFEVIDYKLGRGRYADVPIFTCQTAAGHAFEVTAPGGMAAKKAFGETAAACVGKMLTIKYLYFTKTEQPVPFLPVAVQFREEAVCARPEGPKA